jgi:hypothetical protein
MKTVKTPLRVHYNGIGQLKLLMPGVPVPTWSGTPTALKIVVSPMLIDNELLFMQTRINLTEDRMVTLRAKQLEN